MKSVIFCTMGLSQGGTEWTLIKALDVIDYTKNEVVLYLRKNQLTLLPMINPNVKVWINDDENDYEKSLIGILLNQCAGWFERFHIKGAKREVERKIRQYVLYRRQKYEQKKFFGAKKKFDLAIAYDMQKECLSFTKKHIIATQKYAFFHGSEIENSKSELYASFDKIITVNPMICEKAKLDYPLMRSKLFCIENYTKVDDVIKIWKNKNIDRPKKELVLCTCGRITTEKGFDIAVEASKYLKEKNVDFKWYFVGDGNKREEIKKSICKLELEEFIEITGFQNNPYAYMNMCDIYIQPSLQESFGMTLLEAMIVQKPIISTATMGGIYLSNIYGCIEICEIDGKELANAILRLFQDKNKQKKIINYEKNIDWLHIEKEYAKAINDLLQ